jgi:hypothetical protein
VTATEAAKSRAMVSSIAKAAGCKPRAVERALAGLEVWPRTYDAVLAAAETAGVVGMPPLAPRAPRVPPVKPCAGCAAKDAEIARLRDRVSSIGRAKAEALASLGILESAEANVAALRARVDELEAEVERLTAVATDCPSESTVQAQIDANEAAPKVPPVAAPKPATKPRQGCHVSLELDGRDLLAGGSGS